MQPAGKNSTGCGRAHVWADVRRCKRAAYLTTEMKRGGWPRRDNVMLQGKTLGIIGAGNIGAEMARLGQAIGMEVIAWTFHPSSERAEKLGVRFVELDTLLGNF